MPNVVFMHKSCRSYVDFPLLLSASHQESKASSVGRIGGWGGGHAWGRNSFCVLLFLSSILYISVCRIPYSIFNLL